MQIISRTESGGAKILHCKIFVSRAKRVYIIKSEGLVYHHDVGVYKIEGAKFSREGENLLLPNRPRGAVGSKRRGNFADCGRRLKKLFEEKFLKNLQNLFIINAAESYDSAAVSFIYRS